MKVLFLSAEVAPFSKTGGLADVSSALPAALAALGHEVRVVSPLYRTVPRAGLVRDERALTLEFPFGSMTVHQHTVRPEPRLTFAFIEHAGAFDREHFYGAPEAAYGDNARRFALFTMAALTAAQRDDFTPDVVHANDWQTGLAPLALSTGYRSVFPQARSVMTLHNLAYQGNFAKAEVPALGLPWSVFTPDGVEFWDQLSFLKAGIRFADAVTTVSPSYAREVQTPDFGAGFEGVLRANAHRLTGIINGVDTREWNPSTDVRLPQGFSTADLSGRAVCQRTLLERTKLSPTPGMPVFGVIGRMVAQKGVDLLQSALPALLEHGACAVVLGSGTKGFEDAWRVLQARFPTRLSVTFGFDDSLAHLIEAGSDFFLMPSRFEPCGLNQMYSQLYGAVPIVHAVGGLRDTVTDVSDADGTGVLFSAPSTEALRGALHRALELFRDTVRYERARLNGMKRDFSWLASAKQYVRLYEALPMKMGAVR